MRAGLGTVPTDVAAVAQVAGVRIVHERLAPDVSGVLVFTGDGPVACVNALLPPERQRFLVAHQVGHVHLGHSLPGGERVHVDTRFEVYRELRPYQGIERLDFEANVFAGTMLMPTAAIKAAVAAVGQAPLGDDEIQRLAREFDVSVQGLTIRLSRIGLL